MLFQRPPRNKDFYEVLYYINCMFQLLCNLVIIVSYTQQRTVNSGLSAKIQLTGSDWKQC